MNETYKCCLDQQGWGEEQEVCDPFGPEVQGWRVCPSTDLLEYHHTLFLHLEASVDQEIDVHVHDYEEERPYSVSEVDRDISQITSVIVSVHVPVDDHRQNDRKDVLHVENNEQSNVSHCISSCATEQ